MASRPRMPRCRHDGCGKAIVACITRPRILPPCPPACRGYFHHGSGKHRCGPQAGSAYAEPEGAGSDG